MPRRRDRDEKPDNWRVSPQLLEFAPFLSAIDDTFTPLQLRQASLTLLWLVGAWYFRNQIYVILSGIAFLFLSLSARAENDDGPSAYSVFNRGAQYLMGDLRADQIDREHRGIAHLQGGGGGGGGMEMNGDFDVGPGMRGRDANKPCTCGSGKKFKKCCGKGR